jgi:hypothetical protein
LSDNGPDSNSLNQAAADLEALDARLAILVSAYPEAQSGGPDPAAPIRESRELIRTIVKLLAGAELSGGLPNEATGAAKRRVKIKAASETTAANSVAGKSSSKAATRNGDGARSASAAASVTAATAAPRNSLLARLVAATPESAANHPDTTDVPAPVSATMGKSESPSTLDPAERLARLEAEIDNLTAASIAVTARSSVVSPDDLAPPTEAKAAKGQTRGRYTAAVVAPVPAHRSVLDNERVSDDGDDTEVVIVTSESKAAGGTGRSTSTAAKRARNFRDPSPPEDDDAEVEIVQPGGRHGSGEQAAHKPAKAKNGREGAGATTPSDPSIWRLFRGSR